MERRGPEPAPSAARGRRTAERRLPGPPQERILAEVLGFQQVVLGVHDVQIRELAETVSQILQHAPIVNAPVVASRDLLRLVPHVPDLHEQLGRRLAEGLQSVRAAENEYERLYAVAAFREVVTQCLARARAGGSRHLTQALLLLRNAVVQVKAERLTERQLTGLLEAADLVRTREPGSALVAAIDELLVSAELEWVPYVGEGESGDGDGLPGD